MKVQDIRSAVNAYSRQTSGHPFEDFGNDIKITVNDDCPIRECSVRTQYEAREKKETYRPYKGWAVSPRTCFDLSEVDPWSFSLKFPEDFIDKKSFVEVSGSAHVEKCNNCNGSGRNNCYSCHGKGKELCPRCHGDYQHLTCSSCGGDGKERCPSCEGKGEQYCSKCNGTGRVVQNVSEWKTHWDFQQQKQVGGYEWVKKEVSCSACSGRGHWRCKSCGGTGTKTCRTCDGRGYVTCPDCSSGYLVCKTCSGKGYLVCQTCEGEGKNEFRYIVNRTLSQETLSRFICDGRVREFAENAELAFDSTDFRIREKSLSDTELYPEDVRCGSALSKLVAKADTDEGRILFQEARVRSIASTYVEYEYDGSSYKGIICNGVFHSEGSSPIDEWAADLVGKAEKSMKRGSSASTLKMLDQAEMAGGDIDEIKEIRGKAKLKLDRIYSAGVSAAFWFYVVLVTPVFFNFYSKLNPVMSWAIRTNNPGWKFYGLLAFVQTLILLGALVVLRFNFIGKSKDAIDRQYSSVWLYFAEGFGLFFVSSLALTVALMLLNYLGVSLLTTFVLGLAILIVAFVIAVVCLIVKWIVGIFV